MRTDRKQVNIIYDGLDVNCEITSIDPLDQVFYAGSNTYIPNRSLTPLVLIPKLEIMNSSGAKVATAFTKTSWYFGEIKESTLITSKVSTDDYYIDGLNLVVKKNLDNPVQISFLGEFIDKRTKKVIQVPRIVELSVLSTSEIAPAPTIGIDRPADWAFNPIRDSNIQTLTASVFVNEKAYASAVRWLVEHNGKKEAIDLFDCYVSGQHSHQLIVDTDKLPSGALIWAENVSEEFYNKAYGINPEWDSKMSEVFENRNYLLNTENSRKFVSGWVRYEIVNLKNLLNKDVVFNYAAESGFSIDAILTDWDWSGHISIKRNTPFKISESKKYLAFTTSAKDKSIKNVKLELSSQSTPYTPAPEDLNWENIAKNQLKNLTLYGAVAKGTLFKDNIKYFNDITYSGNTGDIYGLFFLLKAYVLKDKPIGFKFTLKFKLKANKDTAIELISNNTRYTLESSPNVKKDTEYTFVAYMEIINGNAAHFNTHVNLKDKPTNIQIYEMDIYEGHMDLPYFPTAKELAPDGILPGTYSTNVPFFVKYPSLKVSVADFGDLLETDPSHKLEAEVIYNKGRLDNPSKYIDNQFIIGYANDREEVVGTGNSVVVPAAKFQGAKYVDMDWDFKPRPLTLTKNLNTKEQTKLIEK